MRYAVADLPDRLINPPEPQDDKCDDCGAARASNQLVGNTGKCARCIWLYTDWAAKTAYNVSVGKKVSESDRMESAEILGYAVKVLRGEVK